VSATGKQRRAVEDHQIVDLRHLFDELAKAGGIEQLGRTACTEPAGRDAHERAPESGCRLVRVPAQRCRLDLHSLEHVVGADVAEQVVGQAGGRLDLQLLGQRRDGAGHIPPAACCGLTDAAHATEAATVDFPSSANGLVTTTERGGAWGSRNSSFA